MSTILITGPSGFIGHALINQLKDDPQYVLKLAARGMPVIAPENSEIIPIQDLSADTDWEFKLQDCDCVVHLAARVHQIQDEALDPLAEFRRTNVEGALNLAQAAAKQGVKKFIFLSSVKVLGEETTHTPFSSLTIPNPDDAYAVSKYEAEQGLLAIAEKSAMQIIIIRPPMVYGPGAKGNFPKLMTMLKSNLPLPLKSVANKRSMVSIYNLVSLIAHCIESKTEKVPQSQVLMVSDGEDLSTSELLVKIYSHLEKTPKLFYFPHFLLKGMASIVGKTAMLERLYNSLQVDIQPTRAAVGWKPVMSVDEGLKKTVEYYK